MSRQGYRRGVAAAALLPAVLAAWLAAAAAGGAQDAAIEIGAADWPCHGKYRLAFSPGAYWRGPPLGEETADWRADAELRALAETLAASETTTNAAERRIAAFAATLPDDAPEARNLKLARLFHGVLDETNLYRRFVLEGIVGFVARHRLAAGVLAETEAELQALAADDTAAAAREDLKRRRFWQARAVEDALDETRILCHRLNSLDAKLGRMARAIMAQLAP